MRVRPPTPLGLAPRPVPLGLPWTSAFELDGTFKLVPGTIEIDGVDCATVGLPELRPRLALILQAPFLFAGSVADNLSPLGAHTEAELWEALERVQATHSPRRSSLSCSARHQPLSGPAPLPLRSCAHSSRRSRAGCSTSSPTAAPT